MSNPYSPKCHEYLVFHANVCLEQAFKVSEAIATQVNHGLNAHFLDETAELLLLEYSQRVDNILFHL